MCANELTPALHASDQEASIISGRQAHRTVVRQSVPPYRRRRDTHTDSHPGQHTSRVPQI